MLRLKLVNGVGCHPCQKVLAQCAVIGAGSQRVRNPTGKGSLQPVAIGAAAEATKPSKPSMERVLWGLREQAGRNASERRAGLETFDAGADPPVPRGRLMPRGAVSDLACVVLPG
jgi:hypothetical protein